MSICHSAAVDGSDDKNCSASATTYVASNYYAASVPILLLWMVALSTVDEVETGLGMSVDDLGCTEEVEENEPFIDDDDDNDRDFEK